MTKIKSISVKNFKALSEQEMNFDGASAIITAGNNKGKSSVLSGLINRFQGEKPDVIVKEGEEKGNNVMELTDGSVIKWNFTTKSESFSFTTSDELTIKTGVLSSIGKRYFGTKFDIDKFIKSSKTEQAKQVQQLAGIDLSELDARYKKAFSKRAEANKEMKRIVGMRKEQPQEVAEVDIQSIKDKKKGIEDQNQSKLNDWESLNATHQKEITDFNNTQDEVSASNDYVGKNIGVLEELKENEFFSQFITWDGLEEKFKELPEVKPKKVMTSLPKPELLSTEEVEKELENAYQLEADRKLYDQNLADYNKWVSEGKAQRKYVEKLNSALEKIKAEKLELIKKSNLPEDFEMTDEGLLYKGFALDKNQTSSSSIYIAALKLGVLFLGKIRAIHFDASYLDKNSLQEIQDWAETQDLQLLIERPAFEGGDIKYQILT